MKNPCLKFLCCIGNSIWLCFAAIFWTVIMAVMITTFAPFHLWRFLVGLYAARFRKDLGKLVTARSSIMAVDNMERPECSVVIWFALEGEVGVKEFSAMFKERVLELRRPSDNSLAYPELQQYYKNSLGFLFWAWDHNFSLSNHIKLCEEVKDWEGPMTQDVVLRVNEKLLSKPWPARQSPWEFLIVPQPYFEDADESKRSTLILFHLHHGMGDGFTFLKIILNHMAGDPVGKTAKARPAKQNALQTLWNMLLFPIKVPVEFGKQAFEGMDFNAWHLPQHRLTRKLRVGKTPKIPIQYIREIKNNHQVSFTSVLLAATAGGVRRYMLEQGLKVPRKMHVFLPMPYANHPDYKLRNHLTGVLGELPVGSSTAIKRLRRAHKYLESLRTSTLPWSNYHVAKMGGSMPRCAKFMNANYHATGIWSNFPGNETPIYMMGREVKEFSYNVGPLHGRTGFTFTALTYKNNVTIDLTIDRAIIPEHEGVTKLMGFVREEFDILFNDSTP